MWFDEMLKKVFSFNKEIDNKKVHENKFKNKLRDMSYNKGVAHYLSELKKEWTLRSDILYESLEEESMKNVDLNIHPSLRLVNFTIENKTTNINEGISLEFHDNYFYKKNKVRNINLENEIVEKVMDEYKFETLKDYYILENNEKKFQKIVQDISDNVYKTYLKRKIVEKINTHDHLLFKNDLKYNE
jgi:hypothetical protein